MIDEPYHIFASGDIEKAKELIESEDTQLEKDAKILNGKTPFEVATCFGQLELVEELVKSGFPVDYVSPKGYSLLHWAACWGQLELVKYYVESNVHLFIKNCQGETPRDIAERYQKEHCVLYLQKAEMIQEFKQLALSYKDIIADPEKNLGRLTKEDKIHGNRHCDEKLDWIEANRDVVCLNQISDKKIELLNQLSGAMSKLQ